VRRPTLSLLLILASAAAVGQQRRPPEPRPPSPSLPVPAEHRDDPRVPLTQVADRGAQASVLTVRVARGREERCFEARFRGDHAEAVTLAIPGAPGRNVMLIQLAYDPARATRYLFYDAGTASERGALVVEPHGVPVRAESDSWILVVEPIEDSSCSAAGASAPIGKTEWHEGDGPNGGAVFARVSLTEEAAGQIWGWCLAEGKGGSSRHSAIRNPGGGARQEWWVTSYVPADGRSIALALGASADWTDPRDGREYRYFQFAANGFFDLSPDPVKAFELSRGAAVPRPIAVTVVGEKEWAGCAAHAAARGPEPPHAATTR